MTYAAPLVSMLRVEDLERSIAFYLYPEDVPALHARLSERRRPAG